MRLTLSETKAPIKQKTNGSGQARVLTEEEIETLIGLMDNRWSTVFSLCYLMGSRVSEVLSLRKDDIGDEVITLRSTNTKTNKTRQVAITDTIRQVLDNYKELNKVSAKGLLFEGGKRGMKTGKPVSRSAAHEALKKATEKADIKGVSTHSFRRSFATHLRENGMHIANIQDLLGHKSPATTTMYIG